MAAGRLSPISGYLCVSIFFCVLNEDLLESNTHGTDYHFIIDLRSSVPSASSVLTHKEDDHETEDR
jgi:hypothetical protein